MINAQNFGAPHNYLLVLYKPLQDRPYLDDKYLLNLETDFHLLIIINRLIHMLFQEVISQTIKIIIFYLFSFIFYKTKTIRYEKYEICQYLTIMTSKLFKFYIILSQISMIFKLKVLFLVLAVLSFCSSLPDQPSPPILPQHFTQKFVEGYHTVKYYTTGQVWYDWTQQAQRIDRTDGRYEILCGSVMPNVVTPCTQLLVNGQFYIIYPQKKQCCRCCSAASGCKIDSRQQLSLFQYDGTSVLQGQQFYKWTYQHQVDFYDTQDQKRIPRRTDQIGYKFMDFIMASFNTQKINPNIFSLPSYCTSDCLETQFVAIYNLETHKLQYKIKKKVKFNKIFFQIVDKPNQTKIQLIKISLNVDE